MQRVRIGLTGLACVFLLVLLAAAMLGFAGEDDQPAGPANILATAASNQMTAPKEPLAELGVAPGNLPDESNANAVQPPPPAAKR